MYSINEDSSEKEIYEFENCISHEKFAVSLQMVTGVREELETELLIEL